MDLVYPIAYLQTEDFNPDGTIKDIPLLERHRKLVVLVQSGKCIHCDRAKPAFQSVANYLKHKANFATLQIDDGKAGDPQDLQKIIGSIEPNFKGFPDYVMFVDGEPIKGFKPKGRSETALMQWINSYQ